MASRLWQQGSKHQSSFTADTDLVEHTLFLKCQLKSLLLELTDCIITPLVLEGKERYRPEYTYCAAATYPL